MSTKIRKVKTKKRYAECFKRARVREFEAGEFSVSRISRLYGVSSQTIYNWIEKYSSMSGKNAVIVEVPNSQSERVKALERQLAEQQALLGRMAVKMDLQERLIDLYEEEMPEFKKKAASILRSTSSSRPMPKKTNR